MAYCVRCGVKLEEGSTICPLCQTPVVAPPEIIGVQQDPLFPKITDDLKKHSADEYQRLDKTRKGVIELVIAFMSIAVITLIITTFALDGTFSPWIPIGSVILGGSYILVALFVRPTFQKIGTWYIILTAVLLTVIDFGDLILTWSFIVNVSLLLLWIVAIFPWMLSQHLRTKGFATAIIAIAAYFVVLDYLTSGTIGWSVVIALPTYAVSLVSLMFLALRIRYGKPSVTDIVLSVIVSACWGVVAGDFFNLRAIQSSQLLSWSSSVMVVAVCLLIFLSLNMSVRRVRNYFNNRVK